MPKFNKQSLLPPFGETGIIHLILLVILFIGIGAGVYLVQKQGFQIFKPKATAENVSFLDGQCVGFKDGKRVSTCGVVDIRFLSPLEMGANP